MPCLVPWNVQSTPGVSGAWWAPAADMVIRPLGLIASALSRFAECPEYTGGPGRVASRGTGARSQGMGEDGLIGPAADTGCPLGLGWIGGRVLLVYFPLSLDSGVGWFPNSLRDGMRATSVPI